MDIKERLKQIVGSGHNVHFVRIQDGEVWYETNESWQFPIPLEDIKGAIFAAEEKALLCMRWIRKHLEFLAKIEEEKIAASN